MRSAPLSSAFWPLHETRHKLTIPVLTQTAIQSQIITLQSVIITTFLYGPTTPDPISKHLSTLLAASRDAGTSVVDALGAQQLRQLAMLPPPSRSVETRSNITQAPPYPVTTEPTASSASTALVKSRHGHETAGSASTAPVKSRHGHEDDHVSSYPEMTTILRSRPTAPRTDTESTALSSYAAESVPQTTCCLYAADLQRSPHQTLSSTVTQESTPYCPYCKRTLQLSPGKSWEVLKAEGDRERCFRVHNRFVVKCHRDSPDGGYCCVLCSRGESSVETVCGDVKALIKHVWQDHSVGELELEEDVDEVVEQNEGPPPRRRPSGRSGKSVERRRDSGMGASSRRSVSLGPRSGRGRKRFEREVETLEVRAPRRGSLRA
jgi:hypothetical protein